MTENFKVWPLGQLPDEMQRPELGALKDAGYLIEDPRDAVSIFETKVAEFSGAPYAVAVDNCTDAIFLSFQYLRAMGNYANPVRIPKRTYLSIPMAISQAGYQIDFVDMEWFGLYNLSPYPVVDSATRFTEGMYLEGTLQCLSFQIKKRLPIGKGGMILTDSHHAAEWLRKAAFEGRDLTKSQWEDEPEFYGWNMYMTPEDAARGIILFDMLTAETRKFEDTGGSENYSDLSEKKTFRYR